MEDHLINYKSIGKQIQKARIKQNLTQEYISEKLDVTPAHISKIENGKGKLSLSLLINIANLLNVSANYLLSDNLVHSEKYKIEEINSVIQNCNQKELDAILPILEAVIASFKNLE